MTMLLLKIKDQKLTVSSAGMPPIFIYKSAKKSIEELEIKGIPLRAGDSFLYQTKETKLEPGDSVLLMSDGFPELFNEQDEVLDYFRIKEIFKKAAKMPSSAIVRQLFQAGDEWRKNRKQVDDITFVMLKFKNEPT